MKGLTVIGLVALLAESEALTVWVPAFEYGTSKVATNAPVESVLTNLGVEETVLERLSVGPVKVKLSNCNFMGEEAAKFVPVTLATAPLLTEEGNTDIETLPTCGFAPCSMAAAFWSRT